jgi:hypothetical protein
MLHLLLLLIGWGSVRSGRASSRQGQAPLTFDLDAVIGIAPLSAAIFGSDPRAAPMYLSGAAAEAGC